MAWCGSNGTECRLNERLPFVVDVSRGTFEQLDLLLAEVCDGLDGRSDWPPPPQEKECMAVGALNLLNLQVCSISSAQIHY